MNDTALLIECLLDFARRHELVSPLDVYVSRNTLLDLFGLAEPWAGEVPPPDGTDALRHSGRAAGRCGGPRPVRGRRARAAREL